MSVIAAAVPSINLRGPIATAASIALAPLNAVINSPVLIFLAALTAMLFRPPDLKILPIDRIAFAVLVCTMALRLCLRRDHPHTCAATWPMLALTLFALVGAIQEPDQSPAWSLVAAKWIVPFTLFHVAGSIFRDRRSLHKLEVFSLIILCYLTFVSVLFLFDAKSLIFPRFILAEGIGIHADRARGPLLQAVANGVCLNILGLIALDSFRRRRLPRILAAALFLAVPLALLATRTRAVWFAAALSVSSLALFGPQRRLRRPAIGLCVLATATSGALLLFDGKATALGDRLRDSSPVEFRLDMYQTGWQMFLEKPLLGWGSEATIQPEIEKRITNFRPERYIFHNTYLELAVERGMVGIALYAWLMFCFFRLTRKSSGSVPDDPHFLDAHFRQLWPFVLFVYLLNASAVVMNYQFVNGFVFTLAGIMSAQDANKRRLCMSHCAIAR